MRGLAWLFRRHRDRDLDEEIQAHLAMAECDRVEQGATSQDAKSIVQREFGNIALVKEVTREAWGWSSLDRFWKDVAYAIRTMRRSPGFTAIAVLSLALGTGANASVFSIFDAVLLKSLPVRHPEQLRILTWIRQDEDPAGMTDHSGYNMHDHRGRRIDGSFSYPAYQMFRSTLPQFSDLVAFAPYEFTVTGGGTTDAAFGHYVSGNYFTGLGVTPLLGRPILQDDDAAGKPPVAVLTNLFWSRRFGSDPSIVGHVIVVNHQLVTVVGIMPPSFQGLSPGRAVDLFVPMSMVPKTALYYTLADPRSWWVQIFGRLKPGVPDASASSAIQAALAHEIDSYATSKTGASKPPQIALDSGDRGVGLLRGDLKRTIYILTTATLLVLLIACINLANLLLARYSARAREIAIRVSIGAGRWRLIRQMLTESLLLAGMGAVGGLLLATPMLRLLVHSFSGSSTFGLDPHLDARTLGFMIVLALGTAVLFGTVPAWRATRTTWAHGLKESAGIAAGRSPRFLLGRYLVSIQIALSLLLLAGTGLFLRTLWNLAAVNLGFQTSNILTFQTDPGTSGYKPAQLDALYRRLESGLAAIPGVEEVGMSHQALIEGWVSNGPIRLPGSDRADKQTWFLYCSNSFLSTMRIPILLGRGLTSAEFDGDTRSVIVNETFVKKYLPGVDPIGEVFYLSDEPKPVTVVGVAKDAHYQGVRNSVPPTAYMPYGLHPSAVTTMAFVIRAHIPPMSIGSAVRRVVASVDSNLPVSKMRTERDQISLSLGTEKLFATLVTGFGIIALVLAAIGLYGVMAFSVSRRTSEMGIRMVLGAERGDVQWLVLRQSLLMAGSGILVGVPSALALMGLVKSLLYGIEPNDPVSIAAAVMVMVAVAALAAWIPARRASRLDPMVALRHD